MNFSRIAQPFSGCHCTLSSDARRGPALNKKCMHGLEVHARVPFKLWYTYNVALQYISSCCYLLPFVFAQVLHVSIPSRCSIAIAAGKLDRYN